MLCHELQPLGADMPILICGAEAPCAKGLLNPGDDAHHGFVNRVVGERLGLDGPWLKEICPRGNNKVVIYISLFHDKCLLFMLELYYPEIVIHV